MAVAALILGALCDEGQGPCVDLLRVVGVLPSWALAGHIPRLNPCLKTLLNRHYFAVCDPFPLPVPVLRPAAANLTGFTVAKSFSQQFFFVVPCLISAS